MAYHTGVYTKIQSFLKDELITTIDGFNVWEWQGRWFLEKDDYKLSELVNGKDSFDKNYKSDFHYWIDKIKEKDEKKIQGIKEKIDILNEDISTINKIWNLKVNL